jgi:predicted ATPase
VTPVRHDDAALAPVVNHITDLVRERGRELGARIGAELVRRFPDFDLHTEGFAGLTDLLDRAVPELSIVGRRGLDYIWGAGTEHSGLEGEAWSDAEPPPPAGPWSVVAPEAIALDRFTAQRFKSLLDVEIPLRPFNVLVGANGAGKTSVLEGLSLLSQLRHKKPAALFSGRREPTSLRTAGNDGPLILRVDDTGHGVSLAYHGEVRADEAARHRVQATAPGWQQEYDYAQRRISGPPPRQLPLLRAFGGSTLLRLEASSLARPSVSPREQPILLPDGAGLPSVLANLAATDRERLDTIFVATHEIIGPFEAARMPRRSLVGEPGEIGNGLELKLHGRWLDASLASEGTLLVLGLMTIVHGLGSTRLLLMDDIDRALHPKAQRSVVRHLAELTRVQRLQIVCTTHSPYLLDAVDPEDVLVVRAGAVDGLTRCRRLVEHDAWEKWRRSMSPGEFWSYVGEEWLEVG